MDNAVKSFGRWVSIVDVHGDAGAFVAVAVNEAHDCEDAKRERESKALCGEDS